MSIHALILRYHHPEREAFADIDDSQLARYCFKTKVTTTVPEPTETEIALQKKQLELANFQLTELRRASELQQEFAGQIEPFLEIQAQEAEAALAERERLAPIQEELLNLALEDLRRGGAATPEQIALIEEAGSAGIAAGEIDIERFRTESLEALREELAPSLGLRPGDTPILDRGARVAAEATRLGGQLSQGIRGAEATAKLNFPLASSQLLQAGSLGLSRLTEVRQQFQANLRSQAIANRINAFRSIAGSGLGLASIAPQIFSFPKGSTETTSGLGTILGPLVGGLGAVGGALIRSSRDSKNSLGLADPEQILEAVKRLPISRWKYKPGLGLGDDPHVGPMAEDFREGLGLGDGKTIAVVDAVGIGLAATKGLAAKVERIENSLGLANASEALGLADEGCPVAPVTLGLADAPKEPRPIPIRLAAVTNGQTGLGLAKKAA